MAEATPTPQPEARHTPGDWYYDGKRYVRESASDATIALVCEDDGHCESDRAQPMPMAANGNLIAAAPDGYAIIRAEYDSHNGFETLPIGYPAERANAIIAYIRKVEGRAE
jgi:hypothetical protein